MTAAQARIARLCGRASDGRELRHAVLAELATVVPFDWYVWPLTDPATSVGASPLADVPPALRVALPALIRLKYLTPVNRWTTVDRPTGLHAATGGDLARSLLWRAGLAAHGIVDVASVAFRDRFGCWGFLDLWRAGEAPVFDAADEARLAEVLAPVTAGIRRSQAAAFVAADPTDPAGDPTSPASGPAGASPASGPAGGPTGPVVLLLSPELEVLGQTPVAADYLRVLVPPDEGRAPVPAGAYNVAAQLIAVEAGVDDSPPTARVHLAGARWLSMRAARLAGSGADGAIAVTIEEATGDQRLDLFARCCGLSPRESQLLALLPGGHSTRELAQRLFLSEHTVQDHLKAIFAKTDTRTRPTLLSRALGH